jgi:hypothetical protein
MTSHLLGYTSVAIKTQLLFYTLLEALFRILNVRDPYSLLETVGSKLVFGSNPLALEAKPDETKSGEANTKVKSQFAFLGQSSRGKLTEGEGTVQLTSSLR